MDAAALDDQRQTISEIDLFFSQFKQQSIRLETGAIETLAREKSVHENWISIDVPFNYISNIFFSLLNFIAIALSHHIFVGFLVVF